MKYKSFYTLLIEGILVLSIRVKVTPKTFELGMSARPSVVITIAPERSSHISQIGIQGSWAHGTSDSHQI